MNLTRIGASTAVTALLIAGVAVSSPAAAATTSPTLLIASTSDPAYAAGTQWGADGPAAQLSYAPSLRRGISVTATSGSTFATVALEPQTGSSLQTGVLRTSGQPGSTSQSPRFTITSGSQQLASGGEVEVRDLAADASGAITRFDMVFTTGYYSNAGALFGEVTWNEPVVASVTALAQHLSWPYEKLGSPVIRVIDGLRNSGSTGVAIGRPVLTGSNDWSLLADGCTSRTLAPGAQCRFTIGYAPTGTGLRSGVLTIPIGSSVQRIELSGLVPAGTTRLDYGGDDYVSGGAQHSYVGGPDTFNVSGIPGLYYWNDARPYASTGPHFLLRIATATGNGPPTVGHHDIDPSDEGSDEFLLAADGRGCGAYFGSEDIRRFDVGADGIPTSVDLSFSMTCVEDRTKPMTGRFQWNAPATSPTPSARELLSDPGFEKGVGGWSVFTSGALARVATPHRSGASALSITTAAAKPARVGMTHNSVVSSSIAGTMYTVSCWVRSTTAQMLTVRLLEYAPDGSTYVHLVDRTTSTAAGSWVQVSAAARALRSGEHVVPQIFSTSQTSATGSIAYDDCSVTSS